MRQGPGPWLVHGPVEGDQPITITQFHGVRKCEHKIGTEDMGAPWMGFLEARLPELQFEED